MNFSFMIILSLFIFASIGFCDARLGPRATASTKVSEARATASTKVSGIYVFGDSLVDVGNNNYLPISVAKADFPHNGIDYPDQKATGRFSNGKNAADFLAEDLGMATSPPYLSLVDNMSGKINGNVPVTGVSFASGGAGIFNGTDDKYKQSIPLTKQVEYFSEVVGQLVQQIGLQSAQEQLSKSLFTIVIGSNDLFDYFKSDSNQSTPQQFIDLMLSTLDGHIKTLHSLGARKFVVTGLGALGCTPSLRSQNKTQECREEVNYWAKNYNDGLKSLLQGLKSGFNDIHYSYFDTFGIMSSFIQNPSDYGFTEIKAACCGLGDLNANIPCTPLSSYCSNRNDHMFWDFVHPTQAASRIFADMIFNGTQYTNPMNVKQLATM